MYTVIACILKDTVGEVAVDLRDYCIIENYRVIQIRVKRERFSHIK
jgi:ribosomal protein L6P/L9E